MPGGENHLPAMSAMLLSLAAAGILVFHATAETTAEQKTRVQRIDDSVLAPCCYTERVSRRQSAGRTRGRYLAGGPHGSHGSWRFSRCCRTSMTKRDRMPMAAW